MSSSFGDPLLTPCRNGDISRLMVAAIVNSTNETLDDRNSLSQSIFEVAGVFISDG